jgi:hypothetical protein
LKKFITRFAAFPISRCNYPVSAKTLKILKQDPKKEHADEKGKMETDGKELVRYSAGDGYMYIEDLQLWVKKNGHNRLLGDTDHNQ